MSGEQTYFFNQLKALNPNLLNQVPATSDLSELFYSQVAVGNLPANGNKFRAAPKLSVIGDSISAGNEIEIGVNGGGNQVQADSWITYACLLSGGLLRRGANGGISGNTTSQMVARLQADILSSNPGIVIILGGTNDIGQSVSAGGSIPDATVVSTFKSNIISMVNQISAANALPVLSTIPPNNASNRKYLISQLNLWLRLFAHANGFTLLDFYGLAADPANGSYLASWNSSDGTHPGNAGYFSFGQYVANKLSPLVSVSAPFIAIDNNDPVNLITNPLFLGGAVSGQGIPPGWVINSGFGTGLTVGYVTDGAVNGNMWQVNAASSSAPYNVRFNFSGGSWSVGDELVAGGILTTNGGLAPNINFATQSGVASQLKPASAVTRGYFFIRQIVPANATSMSFNLNTVQGTGIWSVGQLGVYNLTKLGLTS